MHPVRREYEIHSSVKNVYWMSTMALWCSLLQCKYTSQGKWIVYILTFHMYFMLYTIFSSGKKNYDSHKQHLSLLFICGKYKFIQRAQQFGLRLSNQQTFQTEPLVLCFYRKYWQYRTRTQKKFSNKRLSITILKLIDWHTGLCINSSLFQIDFQHFLWIPYPFSFANYSTLSGIN